MFTERSLVRPQKSFSPSDLLQYMESLLNESKMEQKRTMASSNYSWLRSKSIDNCHRHVELEDFKPMVYKMSPEQCALTAVKIDALVANTKTPVSVLAAIKNVLEEQQNAQLLHSVVQNGKKEKRRTNKVHPELLPPGRQPTVSFILN